MDITYENPARFKIPKLSTGKLFLIILFSLLAFTALHAQEIDPEKTITIEEVPDGEIFSYGKTIIVKKGAKGVLVIGGDIIVEGRVEGDVATIGGTIYQRQDAFIGGDVIVFGGSYKHDRPDPLRNPGKETVMFAGFQEEFREVTQNPGRLFAPNFTVSFLVQRVIAALFWFIVSIVLVTIAPGAVSRAVTSLRLSAIRIVAFGALAFWVVTLAAMASVNFLPVYINVVVVPMAFLALVLPLFFGRAALQVSVGKWIQKRFFSEKLGSESFAILLGTLFWTLLLSIPYVWVFVVFFLFATGLGLVLTARSGQKWAEPVSNF